MPRGDKPTTAALALKDGWICEDALPESITDDEYVRWHSESLVFNGVRMGPAVNSNESLTIPDKIAISPTVAARYAVPASEGDVEYVRVGAGDAHRIWATVFDIVSANCHLVARDVIKQFEAARDNDNAGPTAAVSSPLPAAPNHALVQLLEAALLHPESAEGKIRQVIETLSAAAVTATSPAAQPDHDHETAGPYPTTVGQQQVFTRNEGDHVIYESRPPKGKFSELRSRMSPEAQERMKARTEEMLQEIRSGPDRVALNPTVAARYAGLGSPGDVEYVRAATSDTPVVARELFSRLIKLAAAVIAGHDFISPYADDNPKTTPRAILDQAEKQRERLRLWAIEIREVADKLSAATTSPI